MIQIVIKNRLLGIATAILLIHSRKIISLGKFLDIQKPGVRANGSRALAYRFHAVIVNGIMAGGYFNASISIEMGGSKVNLLSTHHTYVNNIGASIPDTLAQRHL